jgi:hypothetical protein
MINKQTFVVQVLTLSYRLFYSCILNSEYPAARGIRLLCCCACVSFTCRLAGGWLGWVVGWQVNDRCKSQLS